MQRVQREEQSNPTDNPEKPSAKNLERSTESHLLRKKRLNLKSTSESKELHKIILKDEERMEKSK